MKKIVAILLMVCFMFGCATACKDGAKVMAILQKIVDEAQAVIIVVNVPPLTAKAQAIIAAAQLAITMATAAMQKACPTLDDIAAVQGQMANTMTMYKDAKMAGMVK